MTRPNPFDKVPPTSPVAPPRDDDDLDKFLDDLVGSEVGIGDMRGDQALTQWYKGNQATGECKHKGHALADIPTLMGSSYRDGLLIPGNSVTVILAPEALMLALPAGWATYQSSEFNSSPRGAIVYWPWKDMSVPTDVDTAARRLLELHRIHQQGSTIEVACFGGHGRTGTVLAILAALHTGWSIDQVVFNFRKAYCQRAIETESQMTFVKKVVEIVRAMIEKEPVAQG